MAHTRAKIDAQLPLQPAAFHILLALSGEELHGYGIIREVQTRSGGSLRLGPGTLYRTIQRLLEEGLFEESRRPSGPGIDPRRRYYRITSFGSAVVRAETARLTDLVRLAKGALRAAPEPS
jgi:DNA-binding PadR family transcriptional regulator